MIKYCCDFPDCNHGAPYRTSVDGLQTVEVCALHLSWLVELDQGKGSAKTTMIIERIS